MFPKMRFSNLNRANKTAYVRKSQRGLWDETSMKEAILKVKDKRMTFSAASKQYRIPRQTLFRRVNGLNKFATDCKKHLGRFIKTFEDQQY